MNDTGQSTGLSLLADHEWSCLHADLHIHIGSAQGRAVKITASRRLQLRTIIFHDAPCKGLDVVGIVDAGSTLVSGELEDMLANGEVKQLPEGGFLAGNGVLLIAACEIESREGVHLISYLPYLDSLKSWQKYFRTRVSNQQLSTQRAAAGIQEIMQLTAELGGIFCPAHAFTPHKGIYGFWTDRLADRLGNDFTHIKVLELGLSADSYMADRLAETGGFTFLSNSDAHSGPNIGREYNLLRMRDKNFSELRLCMENMSGRRVLANYGLDPRLGKYHRSFCLCCGTITNEKAPVSECSSCGSQSLVMGVYDRIAAIQEYSSPQTPSHRPPYYYRIPLKDLPGIGPSTYMKLMQAFPGEIYVAERASMEDIRRVGGKGAAAAINDMRCGRLQVIPGGGGKYGRVIRRAVSY